MKFISKFTFIIASFLALNFSFLNFSVAMEQGEQQPKKKLSFDELVEKFYTLSKKPRLSEKERSFLQKCASFSYKEGETFVAKFLSSFSIGGDQERLQKKVFIFSKMIEFGADLEETNPSGDTILHSLAIRNTPSKSLVMRHERTKFRHGEYEDEAKENFNYQKERSIVSPLKRVMVDNENVLVKIINKQNMYGSTPLHVAIKTASANTGFIQALLDLGADPRIQDDFGNTVLHLLVNNRLATEEVKIENLKPFLKYKDLAHIKNRREKTAIQVLMEKEDAEIKSKKRQKYSDFFGILADMDLRLIPEHLRVLAKKI